MNDFSDYVIYVDESGDHSLSSIDPQYPIFVLTFCIFRKVDYFKVVVPTFQELKFKWFGHDLIVFHENNISKQKKPFDFLQDQRIRNLFMSELSELIEQLPCTVITAVIRKDAHKRRYVQPHNPYHLALLFCLERTDEFLRSMGAKGKTFVICEARSAREKDGKQGKEDLELELEFRRIVAGASALQNTNKISAMPNFEILFASKMINSTGLQVADLFARPIGLHVLRPDQPNKAYDIITTKVWQGENGAIGRGLKIFP